MTPRSATALAALMAAGLAACETAPVYETTTDLAIAQSEAERAPEFETVNSSAGTLRVEELATLEYPWGMEMLPSGAMLITEKPGRLRIFENGILSEPVANLPEIAYKNQGGLLDVAVDPDFANNSTIYLFYVREAEDQPADPVVDADPRLGPYVDETDTVAKHGVVVRAELMNETLLNIEGIWRQSEDVIGLGHFGGRLVFAPDGTLVITSGERQKFSPSQDPNSNLGKIIRINSDGSIPANNPYASVEGPRAAVWSSGHRNPLGVAYRPGTGELWINEMGPLYGDELNKPVPGGNFGWPTVSNGEHYNRVQIPHHETQPDRFNTPDFYWRPAISPASLMFYTGDTFADWQGDAFIGGLSSQAIIRVDFDGDMIAGDERIALNKRVRDVMQAPNGGLYVLTDYEDGKLLLITPHEDDSE
ncbi:MAG: PQQ-dependent sugar dehydrogenase, partial [Pseudomonadota bacterium]